MISATEKRVREMSKAISSLGITPQKKVAKAPLKKVFAFPFEATKKELPDERDALLRQAVRKAQEAAQSAAELSLSVASLHEAALRAESSAQLATAKVLSHAKEVEALTKKLNEKPIESSAHTKETIIQKETEPLVLTDEMVREIVQRMQKLPEQHKLEVQGIRNFQSFVYKGTKYGMEEMMHGGGSSSSGSTLSSETPVGAVDDSNVTFTVSNTPLYIVINGSQYTVGTGLFVSYVAPTITLLSPVGTGGFITSFYNT